MRHDSLAEFADRLASKMDVGEPILPSAAGEELNVESSHVPPD